MARQEAAEGLAWWRAVVAERGTLNGIDDMRSTTCARSPSLRLPEPRRRTVLVIHKILPAAHHLCGCPHHIQRRRPTPLSRDTTPFISLLAQRGTRAAARWTRSRGGSAATLRGWSARRRSGVWAAPRAAPPLFLGSYVCVGMILRGANRSR